MQDADPLIAALTGRAVSSDDLDAARRHLVMLRSLGEEVWSTVPSLIPPSSGAWRSEAADRYAERADELRQRLFRARDLLADAEHLLEDRIGRMAVQLERLAELDRARS